MIYTMFYDDCSLLLALLWFIHNWLSVFKQIFYECFACLSVRHLSLKICWLIVLWLVLLDNFLINLSFPLTRQLFIRVFDKRSQNSVDGFFLQISGDFLISDLRPVNFRIFAYLLTPHSWSSSDWGQQNKFRFLSSGSCWLSLAAKSRHRSCPADDPTRPFRLSTSWVPGLRAIMLRWDRPEMRCREIIKFLPAGRGRPRDPGTGK